MSVNPQQLPPECLRAIFLNLSIDDLKKCEKAFPEWAAMAREVIEQKWMELCKIEFPYIYKDAYRKSQLSWEELYNSLHLWSNLKSSYVYLHYSDLVQTRRSLLMDDKPMKMQILKNSIVGYPRFMAPNSSDIDSADDEDDYFQRYAYKSCNVICYYNPETFDLINILEFDMKFDEYEENDIFIILRKYNNLCIITKPNMVKNNVKIKGNCHFYLVQNRIFYTAEDNTIWMVVSRHENGEPSIYSTQLATGNLIPTPEDMYHPDLFFDDDVVGFNVLPIQVVEFAYVNENQANMLLRSGQLFSIINGEVNKLCQVDLQKRSRIQAVKTLKLYGFDWSSPRIYRWMKHSEREDGQWPQITHLKDALVYSYEPVVIIGTSRRVLHIYYSPYDRGGNLKLFNRKPTIKIDLNDWIPHTEDPEKKIHQIEVMEIENGHRILITCVKRLISIQIYADPRKSPESPQNVPVRPRCSKYVRVL